MEQQFFEDEFELFLRENADQHRMYPSDGVWTKIYHHLHSGRRRVAIGVLLLLVAGGLTWFALVSPEQERPAISHHLPQQSGYSIPTGKKSTVTVDDIIGMLRAKSLMPPLAIEAPAKLVPLGIAQSYFPTLEDAIPVLLPEQYGDLHDAAPARKTNRSLLSEVTEPIITARAIPDFSLPQQELAVNVDPPQETLLTPDQEIAASVIRISPARKKRWSFTTSFAPSIGYRNLYDGNRKNFYGNSPLLVQRLDVNEFVDHQPSIGFELGGTFKYAATRSLTLRTGLQLNLTRYSIEAYAHTPEKSILTLNTAFGYRLDTLVATSNIRNFSGSRPERIQNQYLQVSMPVGAELKLFGYSKFRVNIAGTLAPSYLLNNNQYILSNDFTNYVKEPSLIRRWNIASSMEAFFSYESGDLRWQLGPQFRYNLLSTYKKEYPLRENLMEYGIKVGFTKTIR